MNLVGYRRNSVTTTCTELYDVESKNLRRFLGNCRRVQGYDFVEGVNGHLAEVDSMTLPYCERGDEATWYSLGVCCPGGLS